MSRRPSGKRRAPTRPKGRSVVEQHFELADLQGIDPLKLIRGEADAVGKFFLALAVAYNDLKGLLVLEGVLLDRGRPPEGEVSTESGQWHGIMSQAHRWIAGILHELMVLIQKQESILSHTEWKD